MENENNKLRKAIAVERKARQNVRANMWIVYQGDYNGLPAGSNGQVFQHPGRANWFGNRYRTVKQPRNGGPTINQAYAKKTCGNEHVQGPHLLLDVGGGGNGNQIYVFSCLNK